MKTSIAPYRPPPELILDNINGKLMPNEDHLEGVVHKILEIKSNHPDNCMAQAFTRSYYNTLDVNQKMRLLSCCMSGLANPTSIMGCYAMGPDDYDEFSGFFKKALS